jgi:hypothetical protein
VPEPFDRRLQLADLLADGRLGYVVLLPDGSLQQGCFDAGELAWHSASASVWAGGVEYVEGTLQLADITGDGKAEILRLSPDGLEAWSPAEATNGVVSAWTELAVNTGLSAANGWNQPSCAATIRCANLVGDDALEVLAVDADGCVHIWQYVSGEWVEAAPGPRIAAVSDAPRDPASHGAVQTADADGDGYAEILAFQGNALWSWRLDQASGEWRDAPVWDGVYLFSETDFGGESVRLDIGEHDVDGVIDVSSIAVIGGLSVTASEDDSATGNGFELDASCASLTASFGPGYDGGMDWFSVREQPLPTGFYRVVNALTDCYLKAPSGASTVEIEWTGNLEPGESSVFFVHQSDDGWMRIESYQGDRVFMPSAAGTPSLTADAGAVEDRWRFERVRGGTYRIHSAWDTDQVLVKEYGNFQTLLADETHSYAYWRLDPVKTQVPFPPTGTYSLRNAGAQRYVEVPNGATAPGVRVSSSMESTESYQRLWFTVDRGADPANGYQTILAPTHVRWDYDLDQPGMVLGAGPGGFTVQLQLNQGLPGQRWYTRRLQDDSVYLQNVGTGGILYISDVGGVQLATAPSANLEWTMEYHDSGDGLPDTVKQEIVDADPDDDLEDIADVVAEHDFDGDGFPNRVEFEQGTDPTSGASHPAGWMWTLEMDGEEVHKAAVTFGMTPEATDGYDHGIDMECGATPPDGVADFSWFRDDLTYQRDIRAVAVEAEWFAEATVLPDLEVVLRWRVPSSFPPDMRVVIDEVDAQGEPVVGGLHANLLRETELTIPAGTVRYLVFRYGAGTTTVDLSLLPGWNLVSLPIVPEPSDVESVFADTAVLSRSSSGSPRVEEGRGTVYAGAVWRWDAAREVYTAVDTMTALEGVWLYVDSAVVIRIPGAPLESTDLKWPCHRGWNLVGPPVGMPMPDEALIHDRCWTWDAEAAAYISTRTLSVKKGYWLNWGGHETSILLEPQW